VIGIYVPTLGRPHVLQRLVNNIHASTTLPHRIIFVVEPHDEESLNAAWQTGELVSINEGSPSYSNSLQTAYDLDNSDYFIGANDDFDFFPNWDTEAMKVMGNGVMVVGIHDGSPQCGFSTISLVDRRYIGTMSGVIDIPNRVNYPYRHNYVDTEFHATAVKRGVFAPAPNSVILHKHPDWGHAEDDETYRKSQATMSLDATTFASRTHLWQT
jgi:hypothetical protein